MPTTLTGFSLCSILLTCVAAVVPAHQVAPARLLSDAQWREDIEALVEHLRSQHPNPFRTIDPAEFDHRVGDLQKDLPTLDDRAVILRLAELVSTVEDGHTRLTLPRQHPELAVSLSHTGPDPETDPRLRFSSLPLRFYRFADGLFVVAAARPYERYVGSRVLRFGETPVEDAEAAMRPALFVENESGAALMAADLLTLPEVLQHFDVIEGTAQVSLTVEYEGEQRQLDIEPLPPETTVEMFESSAADRLFPGRNRESVKWHAAVPGAAAWFVKLDELEAFPREWLSDFLHEAFASARAARAQRVVLDLRTNHGGTSMFVASVVNAVLASEFNQRGRFYVLVGRETFSAAAMLLSALEQFTLATFVGEPASARPSTYGDPKKTELPNSGLTLRSSTVYWQSWLAGDFRDAVEVHVDASPTASDYFNGRDGALAAALEHEPPESIVDEMAWLFERGKLQSGLVRFISFMNSVQPSHDVVDDLLARGNRYLDDEELRKGRFMMSLARDFYPVSVGARVGLGRAFELAGDKESARRRYLEALELDPDDREARAGLERLDEAGG